METECEGSKTVSHMRHIKKKKKTKKKPELLNALESCSRCLQTLLPLEIQDSFLWYL